MSNNNASATTTSLLLQQQQQNGRFEFQLYGLHNVASDVEIEQMKQILTSTFKRVVEKKVLPGAHYSLMQQRPLGIVYIVNDDVPAYELLSGKPDLCAGISLYDLKVPMDESTMAPTRAFLDKAKRTFANLSVAISDLSLFETQKKLSSWFALQPRVFLEQKGFPFQEDKKEDNDYVGAYPAPFVLGTENCSVALCKSVDPETATIQFHLVIRNYDPIMSSILRNWISSNPELTISQVYESTLYKNTVKYSSTLRNAIAGKMIHLLDCEAIGDSTRTEGAYYGHPKLSGISPSIEQQYNILAKLTYNIYSTKFGFYDGCCYLGDGRTRGVLYGLGRDVGYQLFETRDEKPIRFGYEEYLSGFPLGVPRKSNNMAGKTIVSKGVKGSTVHWGGSFDINPKATPLLYESDYLKNNRILLHDFLGELSTLDINSSNSVGSIVDGVGGEKNKQIVNNKSSVDSIIVEKRLINQECYIQSPIESRMSIDSLMMLRKKSEKHLRVPLTCAFIRDQLMKAYLAYKINLLRNQSDGGGVGSIHFSDVLVKEDDEFMYFDPTRLAELLNFR